MTFKDHIRDMQDVQTRMGRHSSQHPPAPNASSLDDYAALCEQIRQSDRPHVEPLTEEQEGELQANWEHEQDHMPGRI